MMTQFSGQTAVGHSVEQRKPGAEVRLRWKHCFTRLDSHNREYQALISD